MSEEVMLLNIKLIRQSFQAIKPHADEVMEHFYEVLFSGSAFKNPDFKMQRKALATSLDYIITHWEKMDKIESYLNSMGSRHMQYGAKAEHYAWVAEALLETLSYYLEDHWTEELRSEWTQLYLFIAKKMQEEKVVQLVDTEIINKPTLGSYARQCAKKLLYSAIDHEANNEYKLAAREKARGVLFDALDIETSEALKEEPLSENKIAA